MRQESRQLDQIRNTKDFDYKQEHDPDNKVLDMLMNVAAKDFVNRFCDEPDGLYRNNKVDQTELQIAWKEFLMEDDYSVQLTIKLPKQNEFGFKHTKQLSRAVYLYRILVREIQMFVTQDKNNWPRNPLAFKGILEHGDEGFWHCHLSIKYNALSICFLYHLCWAIRQVIKKYKLGEDVFDLVPIYNQSGHCTYVSKEIDSKKDKRKNKEKDEGTLPFDLKTWFHVEEKHEWNISFDKVYVLKLTIRIACWLKQHGLLHIANPINKLKYLLVYKCKNRRKFVVDTPSNLYTFDGWKGIMHIPMV